MVYILHRSSGWNVIRTLPGAEIEQMNSQKKIPKSDVPAFFSSPRSNGGNEPVRFLGVALCAQVDGSRLELLHSPKVLAGQQQPTES